MPVGVLTRSSKSHVSILMESLLIQQALLGVELEASL